MSDLSGDLFELFSTKEEGAAFVRGYQTAIDVIDDDQTFVTVREKVLKSSPLRFSLTKF